MIGDIKKRVSDNLAHWNYRKNQMLGNAELKPILETKPIASDPDSDTDLFFLTGGEDLYPLLTMIKTMYFWCERPFRVHVCCDDGMLKPHQKAVIQEHVHGAEFHLDREEVLARVKDYPTITRFHCDSSDPSYPKLTFPSLYAKSEKVILIDTDVIFFRRPDLLVDWCGNPDDTHDYYRNPVSVNEPYMFPDLEIDIQKEFGIGPRPMLESGLLIFHKDMMSLDVLERASALFDKHGFHQWSKELELYNVLFRVRGQMKPLPRKDYGGVWTYDAACCHYFSKHMYIKPSMMHILSMIEFLKLAEEEGFTASQGADR